MEICVRVQPCVSAVLRAECSGGAWWHIKLMLYGQKSSFYQQDMLSERAKSTLYQQAQHGVGGGRDDEAIPHPNLTLAYKQ